MWIVPFIPCTSSPERAAVCLPTSSSACAPSARSKSSGIHSASSPSDSPVSQSGTMCRPSARTIQNAPTPSDGSASIETRSLSREVFRAKTLARRAVERASRARALASGGSLPESFARFDRASSSWRIPRCLFTGDWSAFSGTWPRAGMMRSGECWRLAMLERGTNGSGCGLPPLCGTPTVKGAFPGASHNSTNGVPTTEELFRIRMGIPLPPCSRLLERFPTPNARDWRGGSFKPHGLGQTNLNDLAVRRSRLRAHTTPSPQGGANLK